MGGAKSYSQLVAFARRIKIKSKSKSKIGRNPPRAVLDP